MAISSETLQTQDRRAEGRGAWQQKANTSHLSTDFQGLVGYVGAYGGLPTRIETLDSAGQATPVIREIHYRPAGQRAAVTYGNGVSTRFSYDPRQRLTSLTTTDEGGPALIDYRYRYDLSSNMLEIQDARPFAGRSPTDPRHNTQRFLYDDLQRLISVAYGHGGIQYRYDRIGNLIRQQSDLVHEDRGHTVTQLGDMTYGGTGGAANRVGRGTVHLLPNGARQDPPPGPHALDRSPSGPIAYDANGNTTLLDGQRLRWDTKNRLASMDDGATQARYLYDYNDRRILKSVTRLNPAGTSDSEAKSDVTLYIDPRYEIRNRRPIHYIYDGTSRVAQWSDATTDIAYYHQDHLGSSDVLTDADGGLLEEYAFYPYGHPRHTYKSEGSGKSLEANYLFTQKERDKESGLQYFEARYYAGYLGRFVSVDPLISEAPLMQLTMLSQRAIVGNNYLYGAASPFKYVDPTGQIIDTIFDAGSIVYDVGSAVYHAVNGDYQELKTDLVALAADAGSFLVPFATGGGVLVRGGVKVVGKEAMEVGVKKGIKEGAEKAAKGVGQFSKYEDVKDARSRFPNRATDLTKGQFEKNLLDSGFSKSLSKDGKAIILEKDGASFIILDKAKSTGRPKVDFYKPGSQSVDLKIRLEKGAP